MMMTMMMLMVMMMTIRSDEFALFLRTANPEVSIGLQEHDGIGKLVAKQPLLQNHRPRVWHFFITTSSLNTEAGGAIPEIFPVFRGEREPSG